MGIKLDSEELDDFLTRSHTMILATVRKSGEPFMTPLWYVYMDGAVYFSTPTRSAKIAHLQRDSRACCLVEEGERWVDLKAVVLNCDATFVDQESDEAARYRELSAAKYADFRPQLQKAPSATRQHYATGTTLVKLTPREHEVRSWYNQKIRGVENFS